MVTFWGTPAAACRFQRHGAYHPPQPFTTNAAFSDLWNMQLLPGGLKQASLLCAQCFLVPIRRFCDWRLCATSLGTPAVDLPLRHRTGLLFHPAAQHNNHTAMSTRLFPPRRCRHPQFYSSLPSSLGSDSTFFFAGSYTFTTAGRRCTWNLELTLLPHHAAIFWESC